MSAREPPLDPAWIEKLRESGLRLDREGRFWHEGAEVAHPGMLRAFRRWLDRLDDGRFVLRLDERRFAYLQVDDAPYLATSARVQGGSVLLAVNDGSEQPLDPATLRRRGADLYCDLRGRMPCRILPQAAYALADLLVERDGRASLVLGGREHPIREQGQEG